MTHEMRLWCSRIVSILLTAMDSSYHIQTTTHEANMYYDHEVEFKCWIEYGMNDLCTGGLDADNGDQMAECHRTLIMHVFCQMQYFLQFFNASVKNI